MWAAWPVDCLTAVRYAWPVMAADEAVVACA
jgi:hypothetical protein